MPKEGMSARRNKKPKPVPHSMEVRFIDGPKVGHTERIVKPPPLRVRYADPEWCTYEFRIPNEMHYLGDVPTGFNTINSVEYYKGDRKLLGN